MEFALVALLLTLFLVGITQFGVTFFHWLEMEHAAREGVRWAALGASQSDPDAEVRQKVLDAAPGLPDLGDDPNTIVIEPTSPGHPETERGTPVRVTIEYESPVFTPIMQRIFGVEEGEWTIRLTASATQMIE